MPSFCSKNNSELVVSEAAPGLWLPYRFGAKDEETKRRYSKHSYEWYSKLSKTELYKDYVREVDYFDF